MGLVVAGAFAPMPAYASVFISEIAWMGTSVENGSFCEWVELGNSGTEAVSLSGWILKTADGGMSVPLTGSIEAGGFYLIERATPTACPDPVPGIDADLSRTFGAGLSNAGEILVLAQGSTEIERIDASAGWEAVVGGDSVQKYTAQKSGSGWVTAVATPRAANATESVAPAATSTPSTPSSTKKVATNPIPSLLIETGGDRIVSTKARAVYEPIVYDSTGKHVRNAELAWAFGDGGHAVGTAVDHAYREAGEYLVVVRARNGFSQGLSSFVVTADPAEIEIAEVTEKGVALRNKDTRVLDLSWHQLTSGKQRFRIPRDTQILPGRTVIFPPEVTRLSTSTDSMVLRYPSGEIAFSYTKASSTPLMQPSARETGTTKRVRALKIPGPNESTHEEAILAPAQAAHPAGAGAFPVSSHSGFSRFLTEDVRLHTALESAKHFFSRVMTDGIVATLTKTA